MRDDDAMDRALALAVAARRQTPPWPAVGCVLVRDGLVVGEGATGPFRSGSHAEGVAPRARGDAHELRADSQAIIIGAGTALADCPALTVRDVMTPPARPPLRVLLDGRARVPAGGPLFDMTLAPTLVVTTDAAPAEVVDAW